MKMTFLLMLLSTLATAQRIKVVMNSDGYIENYIYKNSQIESIATSQDSVHCYYQGKKLIKVLQFNKAIHGYKTKPSDSSVYKYNVKNVIIYVQYTADFYDQYEDCGNYLPYINKLNLLNSDYCYFGIVLENRLSKTANAFKINNILRTTADIKINAEILQMRGKRHAPFFEGTNITRLIFHQENNHLIKVDAYLYDHMNNDRKIHYVRSYKYDKFDRLIEVTTTNNLSSKPESIIKYQFIPLN